MNAVTRRPIVVLAVTALLARAGAARARRRAPRAAKRDFGDEAVLVLVRGELSRTVLTSDLNRLLRLEGCLSGNVPDTKKGLGNLPPVCRQIAALDPAKVVYGPATFVNTAAGQIQDEFAKRQQAAGAQARQAAEAARRLSRSRGDPRSEQERLARAAADAVQAQFVNEAFRLALRYGLTGIPRINDPNFVCTLVFDSSWPGQSKTGFD